MLSLACLSRLASAQSVADSLPLDTGYVIYRDPPVSLPFGIGFRVPEYNRVDGAALPWGPKLDTGDGMLEANATVTYRSHLGALDPAVDAVMRLASGAVWIDLRAGRETFSNDRWIRSDLANSAASFLVGSDARNYFRADRAQARVRLELARGPWFLEPFAGFRTERAWSTGSVTPPESRPWSLFGRSGHRQMRRPNPAVDRGRLTSVIGGIDFDFEREGMDADVTTLVERATDAPSDARFTQFTIDARGGFPALADHDFDFRVHAVHTAGGVAPPQRFAYLGGAGTLNTVELLEMGGDRLLFVEGVYSVPLPFVRVPLVGSPKVGFRYAAGSAGTGRLPDLTQNIGVRLGVQFLRAELTWDPATRKSSFSVGATLAQ